jgi:seryl-tRNA synthetase
LYQNTWYDALLHRFNPEHRNWGDCVEQRRQAFLDAYVRNPYFKYGFVATGLLLLAMGTVAKMYYDLCKTNWISADKLTEALEHDRRSRAAAYEAISRYNEHMEKCNRVIEAQEAGLSLSPQAAGSDAERLRAELQETAAKLSDVTREKNALQAELDATRLSVANLSLRVESLARNGNGGSGGGEGSAGVSAASQADLVRHINNLQQQLHAERKRNKRLKGG